MNHSGQGQRIDFAAERPRILTIAFTVLWLAGWLLLLVLTALDYLRFGSANLVGIVVLVGGPPVALALLWVALGKRESLIVTPSEMLIYRWVGPIRLPRSIDASTVMGLRAAIAPRGVLSDFTAVRTFYSGGCGSVAIDTIDRTLSVGHTLSAETASQLIERVRHFLPQLSTPSTTAAIPRRRTVDYAAGFMTVTMIGFAINVPTRLAITDRPICFYDDTVVPPTPSTSPRCARLVAFILCRSRISRSIARLPSRGIFGRGMASPSMSPPSWNGRRARTSKAGGK